MLMDITILLLIPAIILSLYAQAKISTTFNKYLRVPSAKGITGALVAQRILANNGLSHVRVEMSHGKLSDHYDPRSKAVRLSPEVYSGSSLASLGVAAHEVGHAIQHNNGYFPLEVRTTFVPVASIGSKLAFPLILIGMIFTNPNLFNLGIYLFTAVVLFQIITLPVEFNASSRAIGQLQAHGFIAPREVDGVRKVLSAAAMTYVAAAIAALLNLVRLIILSRLFGDNN
ncbi:MAG: zinc metallopeptidase [Bacillota bacterium]